MAIGEEALIIFNSETMINEHNPRWMLLLAILIHFAMAASIDWVAHISSRGIAIITAVMQGLAYLTYPVLGWISDTWVKHRFMINLSFGVSAISSFVITVILVINILKPSDFVASYEDVGFLIIVSTVVLGVAGLGMYEANAIQYSLHQMIEASSETLSSFIHWYYWCSTITPALVYYSFFLSMFIMMRCIMEFEESNKGNKYIGEAFVIPAGVSFLFLSLATIYVIKIKKRTTSESMINPIKDIFKVLHYSWCHKCPERRSAFTYWENQIPSRINLGKEKYGGPFTNEQVEDVKCTLILLLLMISLFGINLSDDGYLLLQKMTENVGCPNEWVLFLLTLNPKHIPYLIILLWIPFNQFSKFKKKRWSPSLLTKLGIGLFLCLLKEVTEFGIFQLTKDRMNDVGICYVPGLRTYSSPLSCLVGLAEFSFNGSCVKLHCIYNFENSKFYYLVIIPQILHGLSLILVFLTMLEFICAQAPHKMKGLLIGIWYSTKSIKFLTVNVLDELLLLNDDMVWSVYRGLKGFGIFLSIMLFFLVSKNYHYRERDEIVNEQAIIEEHYERELLLNSSSQDVFENS